MALIIEPCLTSAQSNDERLMLPSSGRSLASIWETISPTLRPDCYTDVPTGESPGTSTTSVRPRSIFFSQMRQLDGVSLNLMRILLKLLTFAKTDALYR